MPTRALLTRYENDLALFPDLWHRVGLVATTLTVALWPFLVSERWLTTGNTALVAIVGAVALMVLTGFAGQISLGHAAFLAVGAYTAAILGRRFGLPFWLILPAAGFLAAGVGLAVGVFALRLKGLYLAIVTIGLLVLVQHTLLSFPDWTGGLSGISVPMYAWFHDTGGPRARGWFAETSLLGPLVFTAGRKLYFTYLLLAALVVWLARNVARTDTGRAMMAVRDHDLAASTLGVDPTRTKILAFGISSFLAGVAGAMFAFQQQYITVEPPFDLHMSIAYIAMIVLGGMGRVFGAVAGALTYTFLTPLAEELGPHLPLLSRLSSAQQSTVLFTLVVIAFLAFEPLGVLGLWLRIKRYFMTWPFRY